MALRCSTFEIECTMFGVSIFDLRSFISEFLFPKLRCYAGDSMLISGQLQPTNLLHSISELRCKMIVNLCVPISPGGCSMRILEIRPPVPDDRCSVFMFECWFSSVDVRLMILQCMHTCVHVLADICPQLHMYAYMHECVKTVQAYIHACATHQPYPTLFAPPQHNNETGQGS